jgi:hypothetical protein
MRLSNAPKLVFGAHFFISTAYRAFLYPSIAISASISWFFPFSGITFIFISAALLTAAIAALSKYFGTPIYVTVRRIRHEPRYPRTKPDDL